MQRHPGRPRLAAVLFTDIVGSTSVAAEMGDRRWRELLGRHHQIVRRELKRFQGKENDTAGDGFFATFDRPNEAIRCAVAATEAVRELGIEIRAAVTFGEVENLEGKAGGMVVNTCARVMTVAGPGEVLVPTSVRELIPGSGMTFAEHGAHQLKGLDGEVRLFRVMSVDGTEVAPPLEPPEAAERRREIFPAGGGRGRRSAGLVGVLLAAGLAAWWFGSRDTPAGPPSLGNSVVTIDAGSGAVGEPISLRGFGGRPHFSNFTTTPLAVGQGGVWVLRSNALLHVDPSHREVRAVTAPRDLVGFAGVASGFDAVWVWQYSLLLRVNPGTDEASVYFNEVMGPGFHEWDMSIGRFLWLGVTDGRILRIAPRTGEREALRTPWSIDAIDGTGDRIWIADALEGVLVAFDPDSLVQLGEPVEFPGNLDDIAAYGDHVWVLDRSAGVVSRVSVQTNQVLDSKQVGERPTEITVGLDAVWVGDRDGSIYRVDAATLQVSSIAVGAEILGVKVDEATETIWVYTGDPTDR